MAPQVEVLWLSAELQSADRCVVLAAPGNRLISGTALLPRHDVPARIDYTISTNEQLATTEVRIEMAAGESRSLHLQRTNGTWVLDGTDRPDLDPCVDIDLGWTPATNTLPLRRVPLEIDESATTTAAWIRFPELDVVPSEQTYTRLAADRVLYRSDTFEAELIVTPEAVVTTYGDDLWVTGALHRTT